MVTHDCITSIFTFWFRTSLCMSLPLVRFGELFSPPVKTELVSKLHISWSNEKRKSTLYSRVIDASFPDSLALLSPLPLSPLLPSSLEPQTSPLNSPTIFVPPSSQPRHDPELSLYTIPLPPVVIRIESYKSLESASTLLEHEVKKERLYKRDQAERKGSSVSKELDRVMNDSLLVWGGGLKRIFFKGEREHRF